MLVVGSRHSAAERVKMNQAKLLVVGRLREPSKGMQEITARVSVPEDQLAKFVDLWMGPLKILGSFEQSDVHCSFEVLREADLQILGHVGFKPGPAAINDLLEWIPEQVRSARSVALLLGGSPE